MKKINCFFALLFVLLLGGCASTSGTTTKPSAWLTKNISITLPGPSITPAFQTEQLLTTTVNGQTHSLICILEANGQSLKLTGLTPIGMRLFNIDYNGKEILSKHSIVLPQLPSPNQIVLDIMLAYWPVADWQNLLPQGWSLTEAEHKRFLKDENQVLIMEITYSENQDSLKTPVLIQQYHFGYQIQIEYLGEK